MGIKLGTSRNPIGISLAKKAFAIRKTLLHEKRPLTEQGKYLSQVLVYWLMCLLQLRPYFDGHPCKAFDIDSTILFTD